MIFAKSHRTLINEILIPFHFYKVVKEDFHGSAEGNATREEEGRKS